MMRNAMRQGFTLLEMLVTMILLGILVAVVFPVVVQQIDDAEPAKAANDLVNIRTGIELFHLNVRPTYAGDLEDLAVQISTSDSDVAGSAFVAPKDSVRWNGPYIDATVTSTTATDTVIETGFGGGIINDLVLFDLTETEANDFSATTATFPADADFVAIRIDGLSETEFELINDLIDGERETDGVGASASHQLGRLLRLERATEDTVTYFLTVPYKD